MVSNLRSPANGADYIVVTHGNFYTDVQPLASYYISSGLRTMVVDVQDVYDEFSYGVFDPAAIRDLLAYAYANWVRPAPAFVLLVGDGNYDFKNYYGRGEINYIPPYLADLDPWIGEVAADNQYVCVSGDDHLPDMHLGRLPAKTSAETQAMVTKSLNYMQNPPAGGWNGQVTFVSDDPDEAGDFYHFSDLVADGYLPAPYTAQKVYYGLTHPTISEARDAIINAINTGRLIVNYVGHGSDQFWAAPKLLQVSSISALTNAERLPLMVPMACLEGYYTRPSSPSYDYSSLAESLVRAAGKGAIASWSPTGYGVASGHDTLNRGLFQAVFYDDVTQLGPATTLGKLYLYASGSHYDLLDTYLLFGDPALRLNVLKSDVAVAKSVTPTTELQPGQVLTYTLSYSNAGPATAHHVVLTDLLPAAVTDASVASSGPAITARAGSRFVWDVADLAAGSQGWITITARVDPAFTGAFTNTASIATTAVETSTANNTAGPIASFSRAPNLAIAKHGPTTPLPPGSPITYTLAYSNTGNAAASGVVISDELPLELTSASYNSSGPALTPRAGSRFAWDVASLAVGQGGLITITGVLSPVLPAGPFTNTASITTPVREADAANDLSAIPVIVSNVAPQASDDAYPTSEDTTLAVSVPGVLGNDSDVNGDALTAVWGSGPSHGVLALNADGSFAYTPTADYNGLDYLTYRASDGSLTSKLATVTLTISPVNDPPVVVNDSYSTNEDAPLAVAAPGVVGNDGDVDGDELAVVLVDGPAHGSLDLKADGSFVYTPVADYTGADSFSYRASDGVVDSSLATVVLTVNAVNDPPVASGDVYSTSEGTQLAVGTPGVLGNDVDLDGDNLMAILTSAPAHGALTLGVSGFFVYTPLAGWYGLDSFAYRAHDGALGSQAVTVTITVSKVYVPPVAAFTSDQRGGLYPLSVSFSDTSSGDVSSWWWDFGDTFTSTQQHPTHIYAVPGTYTVTLTASGPAGSNTLVRSRYIYATPFSVSQAVSPASPGLYAFDDVCTRLYLSDTGALSQLTVTLVYTFPTGQYLSRPLPRLYRIAGDDAVGDAGAGAWATLSVCYDEHDLQMAGISDESDLRLYRYTGAGQWEEYPSSVDAAHKLVTTTLAGAFRQLAGGEVWAIGAPDHRPTAVSLRSLRAASSHEVWLGLLLGVLALCLAVSKIVSSLGSQMRDPRYRHKPETCNLQPETCNLKL